MDLLVLLACAWFNKLAYVYLVLPCAALSSLTPDALGGSVRLFCPSLVAVFLVQAFLGLQLL
jgi:hypothetical protein